MARPQAQFGRATWVLSTVLLVPLLACGAPVLAQSAQDLKGYGQTIGSPQEERELDSGTGSRGGAVFDATNPIDLMNRMRRATALDDATSPGDAVDAALKDFHSQSSPGAAGAKAP